MKDEEAKQPIDKALKRRLNMLRSTLSPAHPLRIADVGANPINVPDYAGLHALGGCEVWGFEPDAAAFEALQKEAGPGSHSVQRAVGRPGPATFYPHRLSGLGSLFKIDAERVTALGRPGWHSGQHDGQPVDLVSLDDLSADELPNPDLLKMDIQGGELAVLQTGRHKLSDAIAIVPEVRFFRIYEGEPSWHEVDQELRWQGFILHKLDFNPPMPIRNSLRSQMKSTGFRNQILDGDAVYIRDPDTIAEWTDEQIKQMAIAASAVFQSHDLVVHCLDQLVVREVVEATAPETYFNALPKWLRK